MKHTSNLNKHYDFLLIDLLCLVLSFIFAYYVRHGNVNLFSIEIYIDMLFAVLAIQLIIFFFYDPFKYVVRRGRLSELKETLIFDLMSFLASVTYLFVVKAAGDFSRLTLAYTYVFYFASSYLTRIMWKNHISKKSFAAINNGEKSLLIICKKSDINEIVDNIYKNNYEYYQISGFCLIDKNNAKKEVNGYKIVANLKTVLDYVSKNWVDDIFIATDYNVIPKNVIKGFVSTGIPIHIKLDSIDIFGDRPQTIDKLGSFNTITSVNRNYNSGQVIIKRIIDILGGIVGCAITFILIIIIGPIIYIKSPGKIIYTSNRVGKNGKIFKFYKFRSMVLNADDLKEGLSKHNRLKDGMMFKIDNDPRIIPGIGHFIRKTSLDEFPQFFNVLKGDMSLVGTRPPTLDEWNKYSPYYRSRLSIKPGITGLWQISGRSNITDFDEVVKLDNDYIKHWSLSLDIKILFKTVQMFISGDNDGAM